MNVPLKSSKITITSKFGPRTYTYQGKKISDVHKGIDLRTNPHNANAEILAFEDGVVTAVQKTGKQYGQACYVRIKHSNGYYTLYYHLKTNTIVVNKGDKVTKGQKLGIIGTTGQSTGVHLHFQIDKGSSASAINPYDYLFNGKELVPKPAPTPTPKPEPTPKPDILTLVKKTIRGDFGNGAARKKALGSNYAEVQRQVNLNIKHKTTKWNNIKLY